MEPVSVFVLYVLGTFEATQHQSMGTFDDIEKVMDLSMTGKMEIRLTGYKNEAACNAELAQMPGKISIGTAPKVDMLVTEKRCVKEEGKDIKKS